MTLQKHVSLNINVRGLGESPTLAINERVKLLQSQGKKIYNFGLGQSPFPVPAPVVEALRLHAHEKDYLPVKGLLALKEAVAGFHRQKDLVEANADCVLVGPGSKELMFLLQLVFYGEIIVPTPCWVSYVPQAQILGKRVSLLHTSFEDKWHISADRLSSFWKGSRICIVHACWFSIILEIPTASLTRQMNSRRLQRLPGNMRSSSSLMRSTASSITRAAMFLWPASTRKGP